MLRSDADAGSAEPSASPPSSPPMPRRLASAQRIEKAAAPSYAPSSASERLTPPTPCVRRVSAPAGPAMHRKKEGGKGVGTGSPRATA